MELVKEEKTNVIEIRDDIAKALENIRAAEANLEAQYQDAKQRIAVDRALFVERALRFAGVAEEVKYTISADFRTLETRPHDRARPNPED